VSDAGLPSIIEERFTPLASEALWRAQPHRPSANGAGGMK
jgi:hypothetical protein